MLRAMDRHRLFNQITILQRGGLPDNPRARHPLQKICFTFFCTIARVRGGAVELCPPLLPLEQKESKGGP